MGAEFERAMIAERVRAGLARADGRVAPPAKPSARLRLASELLHAALDHGNRKADAKSTEC